MGQGVNADLTRDTNKFDGTLIRNSPRLSMAMDLIRKYPILITHKFSFFSKVIKCLSLLQQVLRIRKMCRLY